MSELEQDLKRERDKCDDLGASLDALAVELEGMTPTNMLAPSAVIALLDAQEVMLRHGIRTPQ